MRRGLAVALPWIAAAFVLNGCTKPVPIKCEVTAPTACPTPVPHYNDVAAIVEQRCATPCHSGIIDGPWPLTDYEHVADWADIVRAEVLACTMPPADSGVAITDEERLAILTWIRCGFPE